MNAVHGSLYTQKTIKEIVNRNCMTIGSQDIYEKARNVFAENKIDNIPVVDKEGNVLDIFTRTRAFYREYYDEGRLDRMNYADMIMDAAREGKRLGLESISIIEFGVATGNGLLAMQFHAREISRLVGIEIQVYGFDTGSGLPTTDTNELDLPFYWHQGYYKMDFSDLVDKLYLAKLIIGDVKETTVDFFESYHPATIGAISVDVDLYTSTLPIMEMLESRDCNSFLPRTYIWFDDIMGGYECLGEGRAIIEFNERNRENIWISGERKDDGAVWYLNTKPRGGFRRSKDANIKICHFFKNKNYNKFIGGDFDSLSIWNYSQNL